MILNPGRRLKESTESVRIAFNLGGGPRVLPVASVGNNQAIFLYLLAVLQIQSGLNNLEETIIRPLADLLPFKGRKN